MSNTKPIDRLKHHVTGAIKRGEAKAIEAVTTKHTPGPWTIEAQFKILTNVQQNTETRVPYYEIGSELRRLATIDTGLNDKANAALMAAAPELLAACEFLLAEIPVTSNGSLDRKTSVTHSLDAYLKLSNAIRKAKGDL